MPEDTTDPPDRGPTDTEMLDQIAAHLARTERFGEIQTRPEYAPNALVADYDLGYFLGGVSRAYLRIRWFETDDFSIHYSEQYRTGNEWECRWDRHPNDDNTRAHFHSPPDASTPGEDADYSEDWRDVLATILTDLGQRITAFWDS
ncbi:hypothetical protein GCM10008995_28130 [Halobellus salinus]|uniref:Uncharacterized protein n=1 Tax=Halobellus salinus TaxID=931585 RepID=A0A830ETM3_9EURY|nr:hypothetical protein [Halobellus salinus]GGJ16608.1 hypothetical protein GCM10008995_28130 [Halobellus salinus]SMP34237.1 hypothetical protein SAMN06265347_1257 [Halobellus salinus]